MFPHKPHKALVILFIYSSSGFLSYVNSSYRWLEERDDQVVSAQTCDQGPQVDTNCSRAFIYPSVSRWLTLLSSCITISHLSCLLKSPRTSLQPPCAVYVLPSFLLRKQKQPGENSPRSQDHVHRPHLYILSLQTRGSQTSLCIKPPEGLVKTDGWASIPEFLHHLI